MTIEKNTAPTEQVPLRSLTSFGVFVRSSRVQSGRTQEQLAQAVGKSRRWLQDVEQGKVDPSFSAAVELATVLGYEFVAQPSKRSAVLDQVFEGLQ